MICGDPTIWPLSIRANSRNSLHSEDEKKFTEINAVLIVVVIVVVVAVVAVVAVDFDVVFAVILFNCYIFNKTCSFT